MAVKKETLQQAAKQVKPNATQYCIIAVEGDSVSIQIQGRKQKFCDILGASWQILSNDLKTSKVKGK